MKRKSQLAWALVTNGGYIDSSSIHWSRRDLIKAQIAEARTYDIHGWSELTDAQFWRKFKRRYRYSVRRITMRVI